MHTSTVLLRPLAWIPEPPNRLIRAQKRLARKPTQDVYPPTTDVWPSRAIGMARKCNSQTGRVASRVVSEQFWGRAVRASRNSKEFWDASYFWSISFCPG